MTVWLPSLVTTLLRFALRGLVFSSFLFSSSVLSAGLNDFVITIKSDNTGSSSDVQFTLPTTGSGYNYNIDCNNDGIDEATAQTADYTCDYTSLGGAGTYTVRVEDNSGASTGFPRIYFNNVGDKGKLLTIEQWGAGIWTNMEGAFNGSLNLTLPATDTPNFSAVTSMRAMFAVATLANPNTSSWDTSAVTDMRSMFFNAIAANPDTSSWNTSSVIDMRSMFSGATSANPDVSSWDTSAVTTMWTMFYGATSADPDVISWDTSAVTTMKSMFHGATSANPITGSWNTSAVTDMSQMFHGATSANPDTGSWDTSQVTSMIDMYYGATSATPNVSNWNVSSVTSFWSMFEGATSANPDVSNWNTSAAEDMDSMFRDASSANPDVSSFDVTSVTFMDNMFNGATLSIANYDALLASWDGQALQSSNNFHGGNSNYCFSESQRSNIITSNSWTITDAGKSCVMEDYADNNVNPTPTTMDYINIGVTGVITGNLVEINTGIDARTGPDVDTVAEIQAIVDVIVAGNIIEYYADNNANPAPTVSDYSEAGVTSVNAGNLALINALIDSKTGTQVDSPAEIQALVNTAAVAFITTWKTDNPGVSSSTQVMIPTTGGGYSYNVDWGDGNTDTAVTGGITHDYASAGTYTVMINGTFPRIFFNSTGDKLKILSVEQWGTGSWTSMEAAFSGASNLTVPATDVPDLSNVTNMISMFWDAVLANPDVSGWDVSTVIYMNNLFLTAYAATPDVSSWDVSNVTNMSALFANATSANPDVSSWDVSNVVYMNAMFSNATSAIPDVSSWDVSKTIQMNSLFKSATSANPDVTNWDVSAVTTMESMFAGVTLATPNTSSWDTSTVTNMHSMFLNATSANPDTSGWNTSLVTNMRSIFNGATSANPDVSSWNTSSVTSMYAMFFGATSATPDTSSWNTSAVTTMRSMFSGATAANPNTSGWVTSAVESMKFMFYNATSANPDTSSWNTSAVTEMNSMFSGATSAKPDTSSWDTSLVTSMEGMFSGATSVNPVVSGWDISGVTSMDNMFSGVTLSKVNYDAILNSFDAQILKAGVLFSGGNSQYCSGKTARANMIASDSWVITDGGQNCIPVAPTTMPDLQVSSDSGDISTDNVTSDNTPSFDYPCSNLGNTITFYSDNPTSGTSVASQVCTTAGTEVLTVNALTDGIHNMSYTDTDSGDESAYSPSLLVKVDTTNPAIPSCSSTPTSANNSTSISTTCSGVETDARVTIANMICSPTYATASNTVSCSGTAGIGGGDISVSNDTISVTDLAGNSETGATTGLLIDNTAPVVAQSNAIVTPTIDSTPSYSFSSTEGGSIAYSGSCSSSTSIAVSGANTITFNTLSDGSYSDCGIRLTDSAGNLSNLLSVSAFEVDSAGATLTETTPVTSPIADSTPSYRFSSTEAGSIAYSGSCSSSTSVAVSGTNIIIFNALSDGSYSDCRIRVTDAAGNLSNLLSVSAFGVDSAGATLTETTPVTSPIADSTPSYSFSSTEAGSIAYSGHCSSPTSIAVSGTNTVMFNALSDGSYSDCQIRVTDVAGNLSNLLIVSAFEIDSAGATLTETTPVTTPTANSTPSYSFSSTEAGSIAYSGSCSSPTSVAVSGTNIIIFNALSDGSYSDCQIRVTDGAGNLSNLMSVTTFEIDSAGTTLIETTPVTTPTADSTPSYSFSSTEAGSIVYSGSCSSPTSIAVSGTNAITFNELENGTYSDCGITVTDMAGNMSNLLLVSSFEVDRLLLSLETQLPSSLLQDEHLLVTQSVIGGKAPFEFRVDNLPEWLALDTATGQIKGTPDSTNIETYSDIVLHVTDSEERVAKSVAFELRVIDINDSPIAENDAFTLVEGGKGIINVLGNDSDPDDGDVITIDGANSVLGEVIIVGDMLEYQTPIDFVGDDIISYTIVDSGGLTATAEVVVSITYDPELGLPPTLVLPNDVVVDATGLLTKVALGFATATDSLNNTISVSKSSDSYFQPGAHQVVWTAEDSRGRTTSASQSVWVHPLISIGSDTQVEEGGAVSFGVYLNGDSPIYPVVVGYSLSGSADENDHDLTSNSITFAKGRLGRINFSLLNDDIIEGDETLDIQLSDTVNIGGKFTHSLTITEKPFAPDIRLKPFQAGMERYSVMDTEGLVTIYMYLDTGSEDDFSYTWDASKEVVNLSNETSQFIFDPELVSTGNLVVSLDLRTAAGLSTTASVNLLITSEIQQPSQTFDCSVINEQESDGFLFMVEAEPQTCIMRGELALKSRSGGIQILEDELITLMESSQTIAGGVFDFVVFGKPEASTYQIVFPQRKPIPEEAVYLKFSTQLHEWFDFVITEEDQLFSTHSDQGRCPEPNDARWVEGLTSGDWCVKLIIKDGGPNDVDGIANGMVVDPGGLASLSGPIVSDNHDPVAKDDFYQLINAEQIELDVLDNDSDSDGDQLVVIEASADLGFADIVDGVIWYRPASVDFFGTDVVSYVISDDMGGVDTAVASLDVIMGNSLPVAVNDTLTMLANSQSSIDVLSNDSDPDGDPLSLYKVSTDSGQVEVRGEQLIVTPDKAFVGEIHISYFVIDPSGAMAMAKVTVTVKEGEKVSVENNSGGTVNLSLFLLLLIFTQRYLFTLPVNERSHY